MSIQTAKPNPSSRQRQHQQRHHKGRRIAKYYYYRLLRMQSTPEALARGLAAGVFAGWFPLFGFQTLIGVSIAIPLRGNKLMAAAGTWISNPLTYIPIYWFNFQLGRRLLGTGDRAFTLENLRSWESFMTLGQEFGISLMCGSFVVGLIMSLVSYLIGLPIIRRIKHAPTKT